MARPREYDEEALLRTSFRLFWNQGFSGTRLSEVAAAAGVARSTIYHSYGSKAALYLKGYELYAAEWLARIADGMAEGTLRQRLRRYFDLQVLAPDNPDEPPGCPTTRGLMAFSMVRYDALPQECHDAFVDTITKLRNMLLKTFRMGKLKGEFTGDPEQGADQILAVARGLLVLERAYRDTAPLVNIAEHTLDLLMANASPDQTDADAEDRQ